MKRIAVFGSGSGSNAESLFKHFRDNANARVLLFLSNKKDAGILERAGRLGVRAISFTRSDLYDTGKVLEILKSERIDLIVLAGFLWLMPGDIIRNFHNRIVNIHPALLAAFGGKGMYGKNVHEAVLASGAKESGLTVHYVNEKFDEGEIIFQEKIPLGENETPQSLEEKIRALELRDYPQVVESIVKKL